MRVQYAMGRVEGDRFIVETCPLCGETHEHSVGKWTPIRTAHCKDASVDYEYMLWDAKEKRPHYDYEWWKNS